MNVHPGGKQPDMRDTLWNGKVQKMVLEYRRPKGIKIVLKELGIDTTYTNATDMRSEVNSFTDFLTLKCILEDYIESQGHICLYYPKYHCESSPIERIWCQAKKHARAYANGTITRLRTPVPKAFQSCSKEIIKKLFTKCRD